MVFISVLWMLIKQIIKNWQLELVLLIGLVLAVAVFSVIPIYTEGSLQSALLQFWEERTTGLRPPGSIMFSHDEVEDQESDFKQFQKIDQFLKKEVPSIYNTQQLHFSQLGGFDIKKIIPVDKSEKLAHQYADIRYLTGLKDKVEVIEGRWPIPENNRPGYYEVVVDAEARDYLDIMVGRTYLYTLESEEQEKTEYLRLKVVGAFRTREHFFNKPVWIYAPPFLKNFFVTKDVFEQILTKEKIKLTQYVWFWVFDYKNVRVHQLPGLLKRLAYVENRAGQIMDNTKIWDSQDRILSYFVERSQFLSKLLLILSLPIIGMILYYISLTANLTIRKRRNEIAMFRSRGGGVLQILFIYFLEWGVLSLIAFIIGPWLGLLLAKIMGSTAGFLSFVNRQPLPVIITPQTYLYALAAAITALISCLLMVIPAARQNIIDYKQSIGRVKDNPVWQRYYLDLILLIITVFSFRMLYQQIKAIEGQSTVNAELVIDPLLFIVPVLFLITAGLISLRILPLMIRLMSYLSNKLADVSLNLTLKKFSRNLGQYSPLMFFIILTVSLGIYGASIARTMDENFVDSLFYQNGAELVLEEKWDIIQSSAPTGRDETAQETEPAVNNVRVFEPPFYLHKNLPGVDDAARVLKKEARIDIGGNYYSEGTLMAVDPVDFAHVSWSRKDLNLYHLNDYMNRLITYREAALVSRDIYEKNQLKPGDWITVIINQQKIDFFVAGVIDLWPTVYPEEDYPLIIGNLDYVQSQYIIEPYQVWLNLEDNASLEPIISNLRNEGIWVVDLSEVKNEIITGRRDPQRMGLFGMLSISFLAAVVITVIGFFLYTFLSLKDRKLQFGILRAIGLSVPQLMFMLILEQIISVGISFGLGTLFGIIACNIFLPFLQITQNISSIPDFLVVIRSGDIYQILIVIGITLIFGLIALTIILTRMKLHQALKLGEEG